MAFRTATWTAIRAGVRTVAGAHRHPAGAHDGTTVGRVWPVMAPSGSDLLALSQLTLPGKPLTARHSTPREQDLLRGVRVGI